MPNKIITTGTLDRFKENLADVAVTGDYDDISNIPMWRGTRAEHDAEVRSGTLPNNIIVGITDEQGGSDDPDPSDDIQVEALPTASEDNVGKIYQYVGETIDNLINGWFYKCAYNEENETYYWTVVEQFKLATENIVGVVKPDNETITIDSDGTIHAVSGTQIRLADVSGAAYTTNKRTISLTWSDPDDVEVGGVILAQWAGTKVVRKTGSAPTNSTDGVTIVDSTVRNAYSSTALTDNTVEYGNTYYYRFFPYTVDGVTTSGSTLSVTPTRTAIAAIPSQSGTLTYDGTEQTASWNNYDSTQLTVTGNTAINAGTYTASFTPTADYMWSDNTTTAKTADWVIDKADANATLSADTATLDEDHLSTTVTVTNATGAVSVSSGDMALATATYNSNTGIITITSPNQKSGTVTVTVNIAEASNYNAGTKTITVSCNYLAIVDWKDGANKGTDEQIKAMIDAADAGSINLSDYWSVGDERTVHLSAMTAGDGFNTAQPEQDVVLVLMNEGYPGTGNEGVHFVWGQKDCLSQYGRMNTSNTNAGSWNGCAMRADLNNKYYNALPATFRSCLKQFNAITAQTYNGSTNQTSQDYISLFAEKEVFGSRTYSNTTEASALSQIEYYKTASNRIKQVTGSNYPWWERSPYSSYANGFCSVTSNGNASHNGASNTFGVAPFGCI